MIEHAANGLGAHANALCCVSDAESLIESILRTEMVCVGGKVESQCR